MVMNKRSRTSAICVGVWAVVCMVSVANGQQTAERQDARQILDATGIKGGLVVHIGCRDGKLTAALHANDRYLVHGLDADPANIETARTHIRSLGLYGKVSVELFDGRRMPYTDNLVNLVVTERLGDVPISEVMRVLAPRGVAYVKSDGKWTKTVKPLPDDIDDWAHFMHGPDNNAVAMDTRVGPPRYLQWKSDPAWCRSHNGVPSSVALVLSAQGRLFGIIDDGLTGQPGLPERWTLVARDAFNGTLLWKKPLSVRTAQKGLVAVGDRLYLAGGRGEPVTVVDAPSGETVRTLKGTEGSDEIVCTGDVLVAHRGGTRRSKEGTDDAIIAADTATGRVLWDTPSKHIVPYSLAAADGRVCYHNGEQIVCLDLYGGAELWRSPCKATQRDALLMMYRGAVLFTAPAGLEAFAADTGELLWKGPGVNRRLRMFGARGLVWVPDIQEDGRTFLWTPAPVVAKGYEPRTGQVKRTVTVHRLVTPGHHIRCYPAKATERYLLLPKRGVEFIDLEGENHMRHDWLRAPCRHGVVPANGLLYMPPHQCLCYPGVKVTGFNALCAELSDATTRMHERTHDRLVHGPAYRTELPTLDSTISEDDWPTYRHDVRRSGRAGCELPVHVDRLWERDLGGTISQPVVADGRLVLAEEEAHTVCCMDADSGKHPWDYTAGARIDSAPTLYRGLVLFGSADGWVYCLRAEDGELVWRFHAAPLERRIVVRGQLESAWPVHGSVLVQDDVAYCTSGRSSFLDGGMWMYGLDPTTGRVLHELHIESPQPDVTREAGRPFDMEGARSDLLVSDGSDLYMFFLRLAPDLSRKDTPRITKLGDREVSLHLMSNAGFLDKAWFDRSYWTYSRRWPGYYFGYNAPKVGQILVFDDERTYGVHVFTGRQGHSPRFWPGTDGYELFADANANRLVLRQTAVGREKGEGYSRALPPEWSVRIPVRVQALVLAGQRLYLAGPPDIVPEQDPMAAFEGRMGARLWVVSASDGRKLAEYKLDRLPVFDGAIAANGRLYIACKDGLLICMGKKT